MVKKEPKIKILYKKGRKVRVQFDYGVVKGFTLASDLITQEAIKEELKKLYYQYKVKPKEIDCDELDWDEEA